VFGEDVAISAPVLRRYWKLTGGWSEFATRRFCQRLAELALVSDYRADPDQVMLHDVIRAYLRERTLRVPDRSSTAVTCGIRWTAVVRHDRRPWRYDCSI